MKLYRDIFKRIIDIFISGVALLILALPLVLITIWLHIANKGAGAFFFQERPGKNGKIFRLWKFKSMTDECDANGKLLPDAQRLTKVGRMVRSTSIDELPQLWNVLCGDMSLIGPRPLLTQYLPYYTPTEMHRHDVLPGITGLAQVDGRSSNSFEEMFEKDIEYVNNLSLTLDLKIFFTTITNVFASKNVNIAPTGDRLDKKRNIRFR